MWLYGARGDETYKSFDGVYWEWLAAEKLDLPWGADGITSRPRVCTLGDATYQIENSSTELWKVVPGKRDQLIIIAIAWETFEFCRVEDGKVYLFGNGRTGTYPYAPAVRVYRIDEYGQDGYYRLANTDQEMSRAGLIFPYRNQWFIFDLHQLKYDTRQYIWGWRITDNYPIDPDIFSDGFESGDLSAWE